MIVRLIPWTVLTNPFLSCKPPYHMQDQSSVLINMLRVNQVCDYIVFKKYITPFRVDSHEESVMSVVVLRVRVFYSQVLPS